MSKTTGIFGAILIAFSTFSLSADSISEQKLEEIEAWLAQTVRQTTVNSPLAADDSRHDLLQTAADTRQSLNVRVAAIYGLRNYVFDPEIRGGIMFLARHDMALQIKMMCLRILGRAAWDPDVKEFLLNRAGGDFNLGVQFEALRSLGFVRNDNDVYDFLLDKTGGSNSIYIKVAAIKSLYYAVLDNYEDAADRLDDLIEDYNEPVRKAAVETLSKDPWVFAAWICPDNPQECSPRPVYPIPPELLP